MPRLIFVNRFYAPDHSATAQILTDLCRYLVARGFEVTVITSRMRYDDPAAVLPREEPLDGVRVRRVATTRFGRGTILGRLSDYLSFYPSALWAMLRLVKRGDVLIAKTDPPLVSVPAALVAWIKGARLVNWLQDLYPEVAAAMGIRWADGAGGALVAGLRDWSLRRAAANVAVGELMAERVTSRGVPGASIAVIQNWSGDTDIAPLVHEANPLRREWGYGPEQFVVAYSGNLGRAHEAETLLDAAARLEGRDDIRFLFVGGGHHLDGVRARAGKNIAFQPYQPRERLAQSLGAGDVHWLSLREPFEGLIVPSKFFGIAAAGRPVIAVTHQRGEIARLLTAHGCGEVVAPGDGEGLAALIARLAGDRAACARMGRHAREMIEERYGQAQAMARFHGLFAAVASGGLAAGAAPQQ
ncbi:glycosyltransferase family 4 protein [Sphingomonas sp.]|uniref:glycosyltransferase family 4 protein n=1 Tax=Sphingomonas sp. TaxID=28214 RepID=UPI001B162214|nr:glycosyltransferase family 4 protein [Sphingomonas sp.]MBO9712660.1 glycosyltransferase family 4 protein [Sphingomonas sp.]